MKNDNPWVITPSGKARLVTITPDAEEAITYIARVSNPKGQDKPIGKLLQYCLKQGHVSVFEQGTMTIELVVPLAISIQILRHRSFCFQQFSGRYANQTLMAELTEGLSVYADMFYVPPTARLQDEKNRQNSIAIDDETLTKQMQFVVETAYEGCLQAYEKLIDMGIAKEVARFVLPEGVMTRMYITGNIRSFITYLRVRDDEGVAQWEHVEVARAMKQIFKEQLPLIYTVAFPGSEEDL